MDETIASLGTNAGILWRMLQEKGALEKEKVLTETRMTSDELSGAVGWLARENKIVQHEQILSLGETNLTTTIGKDAGKIWRVLRIWDDVDISFISKRARLSEQEVEAALGWLGREDKIITQMDSSGHQHVVYKLKQ